MFTCFNLKAKQQLKGEKLEEELSKGLPSEKVCV
jgi:hypothetical protein